MKLWEVIKELTEHPHQVFETDLLESKGWKARMKVERGASRYFCFEVFDGERLIDQSLNGGAFNGNVSMDLDWRLVKQPVTWQEAIQAWAQGKTVIVENTCDKRKYDGKKNFFKDEHGNPMGSWEITNGTWYIE